jgi:hypothetical protein
MRPGPCNSGSQRDLAALLDKGRDEYAAEDIVRMRQVIQTILRHDARCPRRDGGSDFGREPSEGLCAWKDQR